MKPIRDWSVSHSKDGFRVQILEVPVWARAVDRTFNVLCSMTRHLFCSPPEFLWKIPVGPARMDHEYDLMENSVGIYIYHFGQKLAFVEHKHTKEKFSFPVPDEVGKQLWGRELRYWEDDDDATDH